MTASRIKPTLRPGQTCSLRPGECENAEGGGSSLGVLRCPWRSALQVSQIEREVESDQSGSGAALCGRDNMEGQGGFPQPKEAECSSRNAGVIVPKELKEAHPCKGSLLFGPPGASKTMLAKAVATEAGANFINISMSSITSKWFGEGEKYVKAVFSLASKIALSFVFVDEVDSMLGQRENPGEHEAMRKMKNEFMVNWDGLWTKDTERVLVLAATKRPFDLDEAVIRRLPRW
ncbi:hypothetical protein NL676_022477 [Syzygium grande]|nr:hypothetical protein NL676_022477 [Syzygium grande]